jgi:hypothetical protein
VNEFFSFNLGQILLLLGYFATALALAYSIKGDVKAQGQRLTNVEEELSELRKVVIAVARSEERYLSMDARLLAQGQRVDAQGERITSIDQRVLTMITKVDGLLERERAS